MKKEVQAATQAIAALKPDKKADSRNIEDYKPNKIQTFVTQNPISDVESRFSKEVIHK